MLNKYFVPVTSSNEWAEQPNSPAPPEEKAERQRIYLYFYGYKLGTGDVHVYVVAPNGNGVAGLDIGSAVSTEKMIAFLTKIAADLHTVPGPPAVAPHPASVAPAAPADALTVHLVSRSVAGGSWHEFPSENWIVLTRPEWQQLLPPEGAARDTSWTVPKPVAVKLVQWIYPQNEEKTGTIAAAWTWQTCV